MPMRSLKLLVCSMLACLFISTASVVADDKSPQTSLSYMPSLGDLMAAIQLRHSKLWYAAKLGNWPLANYELAQLDANLKQAARYYPNMPASDVTATDKLTLLVGESLREMSDAKFEQAFTQLTTECNSCHEAADRAFI